MAENNENIKITVVERRGKRGCDYGHRVGDVYDYAKDAGRLCPWMLTVANMYISKLKDGQTFTRLNIPARLKRTRLMNNTPFCLTLKKPMP